MKVEIKAKGVDRLNDIAGRVKGFQARIVVDDLAHLLSVHVAKESKPPREFISRCHYEAGELGYGIKFIAAA
jgi:hypothetical protein